MPHLVEKYALETGLRIEKMHTYEHFFPLPLGFDRFILVNSGSGMPAKNYSYFADVLWIIRDSLHKEGIKIIQVGGKDDERVKADLDLCGATNTWQYEYLVKTCELALCNDSSILHLAGHYNKPVVSMFGITDSNISGAYFGDRSKQIYLSPEYPNGSPSFNPQEKPKLIDKIYPENAAKAIARLLGLDKPEFETIFVGDQYRFHALEVIPDHLFPPNFFTQNLLNIRLDYGGTDENALNFLMMRKANIITNRPIDIKLLNEVRPNITNLVYEIDENNDPAFVENLHREGIPYILLSFLSAERIQELKPKYFDFNLIHKKHLKTRDDIPNIDKLVEGSEFRTSKFILSMGKIYLSRAHFDAGIPIPSFDKNIASVIDTPTFWKEADFFHIFNRKVLQ